jgi:hypothetical protein
MEHHWHKNPEPFYGAPYVYDCCQCGLRHCMFSPGPPALTGCDLSNPMNRVFLETIRHEGDHGTQGL